MNARDVLEFVRRDRTTVVSSRQEHWAGVFQRDGWRVVWDAAQALRTHARAIQPTFPDDRARDADLAHHQALRAALDRAAHAFTGR